jgi:hypothetical protein
LGYVRQVEFRWESNGGITLFIIVRGLRYQRSVGPRGVLTLQEAAVDLNKDFSTLFRWAQDGKLRVMERPGLTFVPMSEVRRLRIIAGGRNWEPA